MVTVFFFFLPSHLFPVFDGRLATPGILPEQLNRGHITVGGFKSSKLCPLSWTVMGP